MVPPRAPSGTYMMVCMSNVAYTDGRHTRIDVRLLLRSHSSSQTGLTRHNKKRIFSNTFASEETDEKRGSRRPEVVQYWRH